MIDKIAIIKMKVGLGIAKDVEYTKAIKYAIGDDVELMIDSNHAYSLKEAIQLCKRLENLDFRVARAKCFQFLRWGHSA